MSHAGPIVKRLACVSCGISCPGSNPPADWTDHRPLGLDAVACPACSEAMKARCHDSIDSILADMEPLQRRLARIPLRGREVRRRGLKLAADLDALIDPREAPAPVRLWRWARLLAG